MLTFLVVDDETLVRENIVYMLRRNRHNPFAVLEAEDGADAQKILRERHVDVLLLDVRMRNVSGLDLMSWLQEKSWPGRFIVISGYSSFDYVHKSLECGAAHYLLKPVDEEQFDAVIDDVVRDYYKENQMAQLEAWYHRHRQEHLWLRVEAQFNKALASGSVDCALPEFLELADELPHARLEMGVILCNRDLPRLMRGELMSYMQTALRAVAGQNPVFGVIQSYRSDQELILLYCGSDGKMPDAVAIAEDILSDKLMGASIDSVVSRASTSSDGGLRSILELYHRCHSILKQRFIQDRRGVFFRNPAQDARGDLSCGVETMNQINAELGSIRHCMSDQSANRIGVYLGHVFSQEVFARLDIDRLRKIFRTVYGIIAELGESLLETAPPAAIVSLDDFDTLSEIQDFFLELVRDRLRSNSIGGSFRQHERRILDYVNAHYRETLTLTDVANHFAFHPNYFSGAFRDVVGSSFMDYLTNLRISEANTLLSESTLSIRVISELVGYNSQSYFQKVFKKLTGITPMEYREINMSSVNEGKRIQ